MEPLDQIIRGLNYSIIECEDEVTYDGGVDRLGE
jgi:hypothetical protein